MEERLGAASGWLRSYRLLTQRLDAVSAHAGRGGQIQMFAELKKSSTVEQTVKVHLSGKTGAVYLCQRRTCFLSAAQNKSAFTHFSSGF